MQLPDGISSIWFVHGLTGDQESTWTHSNGTFTPDLILAQFPTARVITYGYDANAMASGRIRVEKAFLAMEKPLHMPSPTADRTKSNVPSFSFHTASAV